MLKLVRLITFGLIGGLAVLAVLSWRRASLFQAENERLQAKLSAVEAEAADQVKAATASTEELELLKQRTGELMKLRNEVTQLRAAQQNAQNLVAENQRLKSEVQAMRGQARSAGPQSGAQATADQFPRDSWKFAGYATPESALVSAIWAMKEGNPQTYLESLSPNEQQRVAVNWQNMTPDQIAAKYKSDVANISSMRVIERQNLAPDEMLMSVYLEGPGRMEKVRLNQVGQEWKFSGFVRDTQPQAAPVVAPAQ
jgi:hypothetical protein